MFDERTFRDRLRQTAVFGAIGRGVAGVTIKGPRGPERPSISRKGRAFLALYRGRIDITRLAVSFRMTDGSTRTFTGRNDLNLGKPPGGGGSLSR